MSSKLINIPSKKLDEIILDNLSKSDKATIVVSFFFASGLKLILSGLRAFNDKSQLTIITSNYLKSTQPEALELLLKLKNEGAKIYFYDALSSGISFHIKAYGFQCN